MSVTRLTVEVKADPHRPECWMWQVYGKHGAEQRGSADSKQSATEAGLNAKAIAAQTSAWYSEHINDEWEVV